MKNNSNLSYKTSNKGSFVTSGNYEDGLLDEQQKGAAMEIRDYLGMVRRRLWIAVALPLGALVIVIAAVFLSPRQYVTTSTVTAGAFTGAGDAQYTGPNADKSFVSDFISALKTDAVVGAVSKTTGVDPATIRGGLHADPIGAGGLATLAYRTDQPAQAQPVVRAAAKETIAFLFRGPRDLAQAQISDAQKAITDIDAEIDRFKARTGLIRSDFDYDVRVEQISALELQRIQAEVAGKDSTAARLEHVIEAKKAELAKLMPQVRAFAALSDRRDEAVRLLAAAAETVTQIDTRINAIDAGAVVVASAPTPVPRGPVAARKGAAALGAGLFLGVALVVLLESLERWRPVAAAGAQEGTAGETAEHPEAAMPDAAGLQRHQGRARARLRALCRLPAKG